MKRGAPLKRKCSIRDGYLRKLKERGTKLVPVTRNTPRGKAVLGFKKRKPLKKVSKAQRHRLQKYFAVSKAFLELPENQWCRICAVRGLPLNRSTETHHARGRSNRLLTDTRFLIASCFHCRLWPHENPKEARRLGVLAEIWEWGVYPEPDSEKLA